MTILEKTIQTIKKYSMLSTGDRILVALSGGPDSVCLLHILNKVKSDYNLLLYAIYVDHGLRPKETPGEVDFCRALCKSMGVQFEVKEINVNSSPLVKKSGKQGAARALRYKAIAETASELNADKIAVAHHKNDQAETILINLLRGSGMKGLTGISPVRKNIIRPLIDVGKEEIIDYLSNIREGYMVDSSNLGNAYLRNKIRAFIIPELKNLNPGIVETLNRTAEILTQENDYLEMAVTRTMIRLFSRKTESRIEMFLIPMETIPAVLLRRILRRTIAEITELKSLSLRNIEDIIELIKRGKSGDRIYLPNNLRAIRNYSLLVLTTELPSRLKTYSLKAGDDLLLRETGLVLKAQISDRQPDSDGKSIAVFDLARIYLPLTVRARKKGDFFFPAHFGKKKKLQDFFVDEKVPRDERDSVPLICSGDNIIWVVGYRPDDRYIPDKNTKEFLTITSRITMK
ncbi:tRNA(Ile)-lysidine synthase [bacterium BMS3Bbin05]|nr:tRNA(Ile)-lysidine synthase [bacterium BMS3Bbin05]